jgi:pimeloyl-ACP methyl ester carboxylesterase
MSKPDMAHYISTVYSLTGAISSGTIDLGPLSSTSDLEGRRYRLPDGRNLAWCERGDPAGSVVFAFHGLPGSRLQVHPDESIAYAARARVIHVDRPGWGLSDAQPARRIGDWPTDIGMLADHLRIERFAIAGVSGGGPFAAACAAQLGDRVIRTAIISGVGPPPTMSGAKNWAVRVGFRAARSIPWALSLPLAASALVGARAPGFFVDRLTETLPACDRKILRQPAIRAMLTRDLGEAFRNGHHAFLQDLRLEARPWGVAFDGISCPVALWHGSADTIVPLRATQAMAALVPNATVRIFPEAGHFFIFDVWPDVLQWLLTGTSQLSSDACQGRRR